jgi:type IV secretory pathway protease TraF
VTTAQPSWSVSCRDAVGRVHAITVYVSQGQVVLVAPPGEAAVLTAIEVGRLREVLRKAVIAAAQQHVDGEEEA